MLRLSLEIERASGKKFCLDASPPPTSSYIRLCRRLKHTTVRKEADFPLTIERVGEGLEKYIMELHGVPYGAYTVQCAEEKKGEYF